MKNKIGVFIFVLVVLAGLASFWYFKQERGPAPRETVREAVPHRGAIEIVISSTGTVLPKNRLEVKPSVGGRIESVLAAEGEKVKAGQTVAWMSSTERAALLDNARGQGEAALKYWQEAYKPIPLLAPIDAEVIVAKTQPGQTVTTSDAVIVLSDQLIVRAQVDETDIGKIKEGQKAALTLDAYPDTKIKASVGHIYHESQTVNNVTIYLVDLVPEEVPSFFRSGMNADVNFIDQSRQDALLIPREAVTEDKEGATVLVSAGPDKEPVKRRIKMGISDDKNIEVLSGLDENESVILKSNRYSIPKNTVGTNPFMPPRRR